MALSPVELALTRWRNSLIDLSRRNPLLCLRPSRSALLEIVQPGAQALFDSLVRAENRWDFWLAAETENAVPGPQELVTGEGDRHRLVQTLTNLHRRARADFRERGARILHLAFGVLSWRDADEEPLSSPLVLVPVKLERDSLREPFRLNLVGDDVCLNPALISRLQHDFQFRLPQPPADWEEKTLTGYFDEVTAAVAGLPGWEVERRVVLSLFSFYKDVIHQDLQEHAQAIREHPLVQALAGQPKSLARPEPPSKHLAATAPRKYDILDADASQRTALDAAARGESFVLIGPPGTGKSQTIANLIADHVARGKKVLFVSEKVAALEVVHQRLRQAGLGDFCLELHSDKTDQRAVVAELTRCWNDRQAAPPQDGAVDFDRLIRHGQQLDRYVEALHQRREPIGKSAWEVLVEMPRSRELPVLPLGLPLTRDAQDAGAGHTIGEVTPARFEEMSQLCRRAQQLWGLRHDDDYPWRGFKAERFTLQLRDEIAGLLDKIRQRGEKLLESVDELCEALDIQSVARWLLKLAELLEHRPGSVPARWFLQEDLDALARDAEQAAAKYQRLGEARAPLASRYGEAIWRQEEGSAAELETAWQAAAELLAPDPGGAQLLKLQQRLRGWSADTQQRLPGWLSELRGLEKWLGLALPPGAGAVVHAGIGHGEGHDPSPHGLKVLLRLTHLCHSDHPPERKWVEDPAHVGAAAELIQQVRPDFTKYRQGREQLLQAYTEQLFELDLPRIAAAYAGPYRGWFRWLRGQYRRDRRAIQRRCRTYDLPATVAEDVTRARDLQALKAKLEAEAAQRWTRLAKYERGLETDLNAAERAVKTAEEAFNLARQLGLDVLPPRLREALVSGKPPDKVRASIKRLQESFGSWLHETHELQHILPMASLPSTGAALEESALSAVSEYAKALQSKLNPLAEATGALLQTSANPPADLTRLVEDLRQAEELLAFEATQETETARGQDRFGDAFAGVSTSWEALRKQIGWCRRLGALWRELGEGDEPPEATPTFVEIVTGEKPAPSFKDLRHSHDQFMQAVHVLEHRFDAPGPTFQNVPWSRHHPESVHFHALQMGERVGELADWIDWRHLPERFSHLGLREFWEALTVGQDSAPVQTGGLDPTGTESCPTVDALFAHAFWSRWLEWAFQEDEALREFRRAEHEQLIAEFRTLDQQALREAPRWIVSQRAAQWTEPVPAEVALLMKESQKKAKHLPLRRLFEGIPGLLGELKPCLLMSPVAVSQFLPAGAEGRGVDLVVFDEASQIVPEHALGAIYRGKQVVVAGDNQQPPPTVFFQQLADDGEEIEEDPGVCESILDASLAGGLSRRSLNWHYRSRHEHLIAFSNDRFYEGRLVTFPGATSQDADAGVKFHHVPDGRYDHAGRDNPREAQVVADLVLEQVRRFPDKSLGVIAFSSPQMEAIQEELERRLQAQPELEKKFSPDRLDGFFVKSLECAQGDERDVVILGVGYAPDEHGKIVTSFGPLSRQGGERHLNVAVTCARQKLIVVTSIRASDLRSSGVRGIAFLQQYLEYAEHGVAKLLPPSGMVAQATHALDADVRQELAERGWQTAVQVGCASYRVDLAVIDPRHPGCYLLGIEFDGPAYRQAPAARDRDRLRHEVMSQLGWKLHRIWAPAWVQHRQEELERLLRAIERVPQI